MGSTHLLAAITASSFIMGPDISTITISAVGGLAPDIDHPSSVIGRKMPIIPEIFHIFFGHRTLTHSLLGLLAVSLFLHFKNPVWGQAWLIGYGSHLFLDFMTVSGVPLFWPFSKSYGLNLTSTGGVLDRLIMVSLVLVNSLTVWGRNNWIEAVSNINLFPF